MWGNPTLTITAPPGMDFKEFTGLWEVEIKRHRQKRSLNANALLWKCIGSMAEILGVSNDEVYLQMLEQYGVQKFLVVKPEAVESIRQLFRIVHELGGVSVNGKKGMQLRCIVGSSQYDTAQMARLLNGTIYECEQIGAFVPDKQDIGASLDLWQKERDKQ